jgi:hypothetical protein
MRTAYLELAAFLIVLSQTGLAGEPNYCGPHDECKTGELPCASCDSNGLCSCSTCCVAVKDRKPGWEKAEAAARKRAAEHASKARPASEALVTTDKGEKVCESLKACAADSSIIKPMAGERPGTVVCDSCPIYCTRTICDLNRCWTERYICGWRACNCRGE